MTAPRNTTLIPLLCLTVVLLCVQFFLAAPLQRKISQQASQLAQERVKAAIADDQQKTALIAKAEFSQVEPLMQEFETFLIEQDNVLDFITQLESSAQRAGVQLTIQELQPPANEKQSSLQFIIRGPFDALQRALIDLERLSPYMNISHISFLHDAGPQNISATIQANIFWQ